MCVENISKFYETYQETQADIIKKNITIEYSLKSIGILHYTQFNLVTIVTV